MRKIASSILIVFVTWCCVNLGVIADETVKEKETELNFFAGMCDFSDVKQHAGLVGLQHQNEELFRKSFLGK